MDTRKIFVGGLPPDLTEDDLSSYFEQFAKVDNTEIKRTPCGTPRGFGFVSFVQDAPFDSIASVGHFLNGVRIDPKPVETRPPSARRQQMTGSNKVFIGGIDRNETDESITRALYEGANVRVMKIEWPQDHAGKKNYLFVELGSHEEQMRALSFGQVIVGSRTVDIKPVEKKDRSHFNKGFYGNQNSAGPGYETNYGNYGDALQMQQWQMYLNEYQSQQMYNNYAGTIQQTQASSGTFSAYGSPNINGSIAQNMAPTYGGLDANKNRAYYQTTLGAASQGNSNLIYPGQQVMNNVANAHVTQVQQQYSVYNHGYLK